MAPPPGSQSFGVSVGLAESGHLDETASPIRFAGHGIQLGLGYEKTFAPFTVVAVLEAGRRTLDPLGGYSGVVERLTEGALDVTMLRPVRGPWPASSAVAAGIQFSAAASLDEHEYAGPDQVSSNYLIAAASLGPAASWGREIAGGRLRAMIGLPLIALVDHPYTDIREQSPPASFRFVTAASYRGLSGDLSFSNPLTRTLGLVYAYRVRVLHFDDQQLARTLTQSLSIGLVRRTPAKHS